MLKCSWLKNTIDITPINDCTSHILHSLPKGSLDIMKNNKNIIVLQCTHGS